MGHLLGSSLSGLSLGLGSTIPTSLLITRWFCAHRGLALGICMAATGLSTIIISPIVPVLIENYSLKTAFLTEASGIAVILFVVFLLVRNRPDGKRTFALGSVSRQESIVYANHSAPKGLALLMMFGIFLFGMPGNTLYSHISVLYTSTGSALLRVPAWFLFWV